jgi:hypothetical protein
MYRCLLADPPETDISKISGDANKKKCSAAFSAIAFGLCMQKPQIKFAKFLHWDMALGFGPGSHDAQGLPQSALFRPPK